MNLKKLVRYLDEYLDTAKIKDISLNGLQVWCGKDIKKIALSVDTSLKAIDRARKSGCQLLLVHHGLFWGGPAPVTGILYKRLKALLDADIGLYCSHLPLDMHPEVGNNATMFIRLGLTKKEEFAEYRGMMIGCMGKLPKKMTFTEFVELYSEKIGVSPDILPFGNKIVSTVGIASGGGSKSISEAIENELDVFITGEASHEIYHDAEEGGVNVMYGGHYQTEIFGVQELGKHIGEKFSLKTEFFDIPTGY